ncbi:MAG TPA: hypothetical protein VFU02_17695 [Polyangiaceae bacterium]|nr:hypothetical protein [Polyangiaceae bacterium]
MVSITDAKVDAAAERAFTQRTPFSHFRIDGVAAPGSAFTVHKRTQKLPGCTFSGTQVGLPNSGEYRIMLFNAIWSEGTSDPQSVVVDVYDVGASAVVASFSVERPSADPADAVQISGALLYVEADTSLVGPIEFRNGGSATQRAALAARLWQLPESWPRPDPLARYYRSWHIRRPAGESYGLLGAFEVEVDAKTGEHIRRSIRRTDTTSQVPWNENGPLPGNYQVQVTGTLENLSSSPATLSVRLYSDDDLLHTESVAAAGLETVDVEIDDTFTLNGRLDVRSGNADQEVDFLVRVFPG